MPLTPSVSWCVRSAPIRPGSVAGVQPDWPIETERLTLRPFEEGDFEGFAAMQGDPECARCLYNESRSRELYRCRLDARLP